MLIKVTPKLILQDGNSNAITAVAFSPNGQTIAAGNRNNTIKLWNAETGELFRTLEGYYANGFSVAFSPDGKFVASGSDGSTIKLWDIETGEPVFKLVGYLSKTLAFSPDGKTLAAGCVIHSAIKLFNTETGELIHTLYGHSDTVYALSFSPDGKTLASGSGGRVSSGWSNFDPDKSNNTIKLWNVESGVLVRTLEGHSSANERIDNLVNASTGDVEEYREVYTDSVYSVASSPDGNVLATGCSNTTIRLWHASNGKFIRILGGHKADVVSIVFSPLGRIIASGSADKTINFYNTETGKLVFTLKEDSGRVRSLAFSPDGKTLVAGSEDVNNGTGAIKLWNIEIEASVDVDDV